MKRRYFKEEWFGGRTKIWIYQEKDGKSYIVWYGNLLACDISFFKDHEFTEISEEEAFLEKM